MRGKVNKILSLKFVFLFGIFMLTISNSLHTSINNILSKNIFNKECLKPIFAEKDISDSIAIRLDTFLKRIEFNGSILVEFKNEVVYYRNFGYRKLPKKSLINDSTSFQIASISKQFTAVAIMMLKERGLLTYDDLVRKYIPEFPYDTITIKHLLTHKSGLQDYVWIFEKEWKEKRQPSNQDLLIFFITQKLSLHFQPGTQNLYSNSGYCFLAMIIEKITNQKLQDFLAENIFKPLEMRNTYLYYGAKTRKSKNRALGYKNRRDRWIPFTDTIYDAIVGDKGIYSTTMDMYKWNLAIENRILINDSTFQEALDPFPLDTNKQYRYGYGWRIKEAEGERLVYHNGTWQGFKTSCVRMPDYHSTIIILNNAHQTLIPIIGRIKQLINEKDSLMRSASKKNEEISFY